MRSTPISSTAMVDSCYLVQLCWIASIVGSQGSHFSLSCNLKFSRGRIHSLGHRNVFCLPCCLLFPHICHLRLAFPFPIPPVPFLLEPTWVKDQAPLCLCPMTHRGLRSWMRAAPSVNSALLTRDLARRLTAPIGLACPHQPSLPPPVTAAPTSLACPIGLACLCRPRLPLSASPAPMATRTARNWYSALGSGFGLRLWQSALGFPSLSFIYKSIVILLLG